MKVVKRRKDGVVQRYNKKKETKMFVDTDQQRELFKGAEEDGFKGSFSSWKRMNASIYDYEEEPARELVTVYHPHKTVGLARKCSAHDLFTVSEDWDNLSEDEKETRLNKIIKQSRGQHAYE